MNKNLKIAIVGATGAVGEVLLDILADLGVHRNQLVALASSTSIGSAVDYGRQEITVTCLDDFDFNGIDYALFSAGGSVSEVYAPKAVAAGCTVIDNTSAFRMHDDIPLIIPEVNGDLLQEFQRPGIIANPNCSTIQMLVALAPIYKSFGIERINVATYQAVSGAGRKAQEELAHQAVQKLSFQEIESTQFDQQMIFNVLPQIDVLEDNGYSREEMKMHRETQKILASDTVSVNATAVRVPVFFGHAEAVHLETSKAFEIEAVEELLRQAEGVEFVANTDAASHPTPAVHAAGADPVFVGRVRRDHSNNKGLNMWVVADNVRKGAALNAIQIMQKLEELQCE